MKMTLILTFLLAVFAACSNTDLPKEKADSAKIANQTTRQAAIITGAQQVDKYLPMLKGKKVALAINNTSVIDGKLSMDTLLKLGVNIVKGFGPEHGFRGKASAGAKIGDETDEKTGVPLISLYGSKYKPTKADMQGIDVMVFDMQDVGVRFYTYLSTLHYIMEACAENNVDLIVLDRPNPNDGYVDGPVREPDQESFVGKHAIPILHGLTFGEYAGMINGEGWLPGKAKSKLTVIKMQNYNHGKPYILPIAPSPNLNTQQSILLYPSLCLFEGTVISQGRGTLYPFTVLGNPELKGKYDFSFKPVSIPGMSESPPHMDKDCYGIDLRTYDTGTFAKTGRINLTWLKQFYADYPNKAQFFRAANFDRLAGTSKLRTQIIEGKSEEEIRQSWEPALGQYKETRKKYLLY
ncbi:Uncharacterized conserved protein YbbC, DUF1343 family [Daejeonella lutea]|uniref:Uncharacterized conserved protein YbbC, DUF1343 family n=2 Tax=Daejeonella lutea TaxID=572036 RepID=A0A1T5EAR3_9SPHI|nr:Uncharacterized conserved protein YbbC, DUF1343 family [Daejeonella lutea]